MSDQNQTPPTQTVPARPLDEIWKDIEALKITPDELAQAAKVARVRRQTKDQIEKVRAELQKQAQPTTT